MSAETEALEEQAAHRPQGRRGWRPPRPGRAAVWAGILGLGLLAALHTHGKIIRTEWYPFAVWMLIPGFMAWLWAREANPGKRPIRHQAPLLVLAGIAVLAVFASLVLHKWFFFLRWAPASTVIAAGGLSRFVMFTALLVPLYAWAPRRTWILPLITLVGAELLCVHMLVEQTDWRALYRTDHPSFMFRLWEFSRCFPQLANYLPNWNGGLVHIYSVVSGSSGPGLALLPLFRYFPVHEVYTLSWILMFLVIVPWIGVFSARALGARWTGAFVGGILSLGISQHFFLWALHFGTIGAAFTGAMTMPVCVLGYRLVYLRRLGWAGSLALVVSGGFLLLWAPGALVAIGVALAALLAADRWTWRTVRRAALIALGIGLFAAPFVLTIYTYSMDTVAFITTPSAAPAAAEVTEAAAGGWSARWARVQPSLMRGLLHLRAHTHEANPLILVFGVVGVLAGVNRRLRRWFVPIFIVLALITGWAREVMPLSQLSRMSIPLFFAAVPPAALFIGRLLQSRDRRFALPRAAVMALLVCSGLNVALICGNRGLARYVSQGERVDELVDWLRAETPADGRILFAGRCVHRYGGGNVAYLSVLAEREMMAVDYYGFPPEKVLYEYPPRHFRHTPELMQTFFDAYNVSHLITWHGHWMRQFRDEPERYREVFTNDVYAVFARTSHPGMFHQGRGQVRASANRIEVTLEDPHAPAVVAYNWVPGLRAPPPVRLYPHEVVDGLVLIGIEPNGTEAFTITYRAGLLRIPGDE